MIATSKSEFFSPRARLHRISVALLLAVSVAFIVAVWSAAGIEDKVEDGGARLGGDYPAFHAAGAIALDGDIENLYVESRQRSEQVTLVPAPGYVAFAYPPHVAYAYAPFAALGFRIGYTLHSLLMASALIGALAVLRKPVPIIGEWFLPIVAGSLTFYPLLRAVTGGQNTAFTLLLFASTWRFLHDNRELQAGLVLGLLWFRPQYALPVIGLLFLARKFKAVGVASVLGVITWALTAMAAGINWVPRWIEAAREFVDRDTDINKGISVSMAGFIEGVFGESTLLSAIGFVLAGLVVVALMWMWFNHERVDLGIRMGAAAIGVLLISPHTLYYDYGLVLIAAIAVLALTPTITSHRLAVQLVCAGWLSAFIQPVARWLGWTEATPLALALVVAFAGAVWFAQQQISGAIGPTPGSINNSTTVRRRTGIL